ncbi:MAG: alkaline phosphatase family protein [Candidatus Edwardsbacteria bacterium]|nr:alkaline phosphatase family protein [Candidatus Edwardsbacteria bacterium]
MLKPDYKGGSIVNLMAGIAARFGHSTGYRELAALPTELLCNYRNVVLIVLDGLGYEYLINRGEESFLRRQLRAKLTSVFPTTTASCIATFATGVAPNQHGITGWFTHLSELGAVSKILFAEPRFGALKFRKAGIKFKKLLLAGPVFDRLKTKCFVITPQAIARGDFSRAASGRAKVIPYKTLNGFLGGIKKALKTRPATKFISAYWPDIDHLCHHQGIEHAKTARHFRELDRRLERLAAWARGTNTIFLIAADHGLIETPRGQCIELKDHPRLAECLTLPLCGEPRLAYCYVRPDKVAQFKRYVRNRLKKYCDLATREELIRQGFYGKGKPDPRFETRVGDFILIMKPGWCIKDFLPGEERVFLKANHGGLSAAEMYVPLAVVGC